MIRLTYLVLLFSIFSCQLIEEKDEWWKYGEGYNIGDVIEIESNNFKIINDTIFKDELAKAIIVKIERRIIDKKMIIKSLSSDETGTYYLK